MEEEGNRPLEEICKYNLNKFAIPIGLKTRNKCNTCDGYNTKCDNYVSIHNYKIESDPDGSGLIDLVGRF